MAALDAAIGRLQLMVAAGPAVAEAAAKAMATVVEDEVKNQLAKSSHAPGTPTPSPPGSPPSMISGALQRSVMSKSVGLGHYQVGGTTVYARIQELGGVAGRGSVLPARPYLAPAMDVAKELAYTEAIAAIARVISGG